jgi:cytidylate kinase
MAVITISRESGAQGTHVARKLAQRLGYRYVDREVIHEVSLEYGIRQDEFEHIYEQAPGLLERYDHRNREIVQLFGRIIQGLAQRDDVVIIGRGAFAALRDYGDVLNVRIVARRSLRVQRLQEEEGLKPKEARAKLDRLDSERSKYVGAYLGLNWADAGLYDLCVNTDKLDVDSAVALIEQTLAHLEQDRSSDKPLIRDGSVDPILDRAITEALNLLQATGRAVES